MKSRFSKIDFKALTQKETDLDSLKENIPKALTKVNDSLVQTGKTHEATVIIGLPYSGKSTFLNALAKNLKIIKKGEEFVFDQSVKHNEAPEIKHEYEPAVYYPKKFVIAGKVFWECSSKTGTTDVVIQELINVFFIKNLIKITNKLNFILILEEGTVEAPVGFNNILTSFKNIFPTKEHTKLKGNVMCVITKYHGNNHDKIILILQNSLTTNNDILALSDIKFFYKPTSQNGGINLTLEWKDLEESAGVQNLEIRKLGSFLHEQDILIANLHTQTQLNVEGIINTIQSIFRDFNISTPINCSKFLDNNNYRDYVKPYLPNAQIQYPALEKTFSYFDGLTQLLEFQAIISNKQDNNLIAAILQILDCIEKFASNQQIIQNYNYVLDLQIKELLLFEEMLSTTWSQSNECYSSLIEKLEAFKQTNYPSSIKNIEPKNDQLVKYYKEALDWLNKYDKPHPAEITKTKAVCYSKIGDILSEEGNYKNALANYHLTLVYNKELKRVNNKIGDMLFKLEHEKLAIIFYKVNDSLNLILKCYKSLIDKAEKNLSQNQDLIHDLYIEQGKYLCSQKQQKSYAIASYYKAADYASDPIKERDALLMAYNTSLGTLDNNEIQQTDMLEQQRKEHLRGIIGDIVDLDS